MEPHRSEDEPVPSRTLYPPRSQDGGVEIRTLVTGAAGFVGSAVALRLVEEGFDVHGLVRTATSPGRLGGGGGGVSLHTGDLTEPGDLADAIRRIDPQLVVHAAAHGGHPVGAEGRRVAWHDTVTGTLNLVEALRDRPPQRFVHLGSPLEYRPGGNSTDDVTGRTAGVNGRCGPTTFRGAMKAASTLLVRQWSAEIGAPCVVLRPFSVYGPHQQPQRVIPVLLGALRSGSPFAVAGGDTGRDFVYIDDVVDAVVAVIRTRAADGGEFNVGCGEMTTITRLIATAEEVTGRRAVLAGDVHPGTVADGAVWSADLGDTTRVLGWAPRTSLAEGLRITWSSG